MFGVRAELAISGFKVLGEGRRGDASAHRIDRHERKPHGEQVSGGIGQHRFEEPMPAVWWKIDHGGADVECECAQQGEFPPEQKHTLTGEGEAEDAEESLYGADPDTPQTKGGLNDEVPESLAEVRFVHDAMGRDPED